MQTTLDLQTPHERLRKLTRWQLRYMGYLARTGGATDHQAAKDLRRPLSSINSTRNALREYVEDSGKKHKSPKEYGGKPVTVWRLK